MAYQNLKPWTDSITGAQCSGTAGTGRTYTLAHSPAIPYNTQCLLQGSPLTYGYDFVLAGQVITFNVFVDDSFVIQLDYFTGTPILESSGDMYTTLDLVQSEIRASTAFSSSTLPTDSDVTRWIQQASRRIDLLSNTTFGSTVVSSELADYAAQNRVFQFPHAPLLSVEKVEYNMNGWGLAPSWVTLVEGADADYITYLEENEIQFVAGINSILQRRPQSGLQRLRVSYTWGASSVPLEVEQLCTLMVAKRVVGTLINNVANNTGGVVGVGPVKVSDPTSFSTNYLKDLNAQIAELSKDLGITFKVFKFTRTYDPINVDTGFNSGGYYG